MKTWFSAAELAGLPGIPGTTQKINARAKRENWNSRKKSKGKGLEYDLNSLPITTQAALLTTITSESPAPPAGGSPSNQGLTSPGVTDAAPSTHTTERADTPAGSPDSLPGDEPAPFSYCRDELWLWAESRSQAQRDKGFFRANLLRQVMNLVANGQTFRNAATSVGLANGVSAANLRNWYYGANGKPGAQAYDIADWPAALISGHTGRITTATCSPEAWDYFKADYLRLEAPKARAVYNRLKRAAKAHGWSIPSQRTLERRIKREVPRAAVLLARQGKDALKYSYPAQERDRSVFHAIEGVNADGHKFDVFVKWPDGEVGRPLMVAWQDLYSGKLLSYRVDKTENTDSVRLSFGDMVEKYGIPEHVYLDNGRSFASKWMTGGVKNRYRFKVREDEPDGIIKNLGAEVHWATPYHGQSKPIERMFLDLCEYVAKHPAFSGAYTGNNPTAKPENYGSNAIPLDKFLAILDSEIADHNAREGRLSKTCAGRSLDATFNESYEHSPIRKATAQQRRLWLLAAEGIKVRKDGTITLNAEKENRYWNEMLHDLAGQKMVVRFDPQDLHSLVHVYTLDGRYICEAKCIEAAGFNDTVAAREHAKARNQFKRAAKEQLKANRRMDALEAAKLLPTVTPTETADPRIVRPFRPATALRNEPLNSPLNDGQKAEIAEFQANFKQPTTPVVEADDPRRRFERWQRLDTRIQEGKQIDEQDQRWHQRYPESDEYRSMKEFFADFEGFGLGQ